MFNCDNDIDSDNDNDNDNDNDKDNDLTSITYINVELFVAMFKQCLVAK